MWSTPIGMRKKLGVSVIAAFLDSIVVESIVPEVMSPRRGARRTKLLGWNAAHQRQFTLTYKGSI